MACRRALGTPGAGAAGPSEGFLERVQSCGHGSLEAWPGSRRRLGISTLRVAYLTTRVTTISPQSKVPPSQVVHAQVEQLYSDGTVPIASGHDRVHAQIHVAVRREVVMVDRQAVERREKALKGVGIRRPDRRINNRSSIPGQMLGDVVFCRSRKPLLLLVRLVRRI